MISNKLRVALENSKVEVKDILQSINLKNLKDSEVIAYSSYLEGLGNRNSDIDIYAIQNCEDQLNTPREGFRMEIVYIKDTVLDIEYWSYGDINRILSLIQEKKINEVKQSELKFLLRLLYGELLIESELGVSIKKRINDSELLEVISEKFALNSRSYLDDAAKMYEVGEYILAMDCARRSLWEAVAFVNSKNGHPNLKYKWISKIFIDNNGFNNSELLNKYIKLQVYPHVTENNIQEYIKEIILLCQSMLAIGLFND